jgi:hypothetical protein
MNTPENRSLVVEQNLADYAVQWTAASMPLDQIDATTSEHLQNRGGIKLDDDNIVQMAVRLESDPDKVLPRLVVARYRGKVTIVDGNHRAAAYRLAGRTHVDVYLIEEAAGEVIEQLVLEANAGNGKGLTPEERLHLALKYADLTNDLKLAALRYGYRYDTLATKKRAQQGREKARRAAGVKAPMPDAKADAVNRLHESQLRMIGRELLEQVDTRTLADAVKNITAVDVEDQAMQVREEIGRMAQSIKDKKTPAGRVRAKKTGPTIKGARDQLRRITAQVKANPSWRADADLIAAVEQLAEEVGRGRAAQHAA